ncbi:ribosome maturation factor RimM [Treponema zuelzerae]|uniref:Ribosome maturation factor RimM n=1 Tax=Teretinema zuelzerae TaxID=156 RepID=A0AAE3JHU5_9SPIR|nr:ribosome maturation factor RimM [Teretinema zuelzerae]MCD1653428.1 ribosome maturation factor RimM [Teretinema zuelzerae]
MDLMITGVVRSAHGLDGFVRVDSSSGEVDHFADLSSVVLRINKTGAEKSYDIEAVEGHSQCLLIKFRGIDTPEQAKTLAGAQILVPRDLACPLSEGEYYVSDLCQCVLVYEGLPIGNITDVVEGGAGDLLAVTLFEGSVPESVEASTHDASVSKKDAPSGKQTRLVPMRKEFVGKVDLQARTVELMHRWILD